MIKQKQKNTGMSRELGLEGKIKRAVNIFGSLTIYVIVI